jgi:hypothetical protein
MMAIPCGAALNYPLCTPPPPPAQHSAVVPIAMSSSGAITLGEVGGKLKMLEIACSRCDRRGRLRVAGLIERYGANAKMPDLREILAGDCPRVGSVSVYDRCGAHFPQLLRGLDALT